MRSTFAQVLFFSIAFSMTCRAQDAERKHDNNPDSASMLERINLLRPVVISATRSERQLDELPVPVTVIGKEQIKKMGSLRLNDVLGEQTGLAIVSDHGTGVQLQGFASEYTLILVDGEPLVGRTAGTFDLTRIAVGNIKQVEIVKGPSSSLYGSDALAGVINIITDRPEGTRAEFNSRYGTNATTDLSTSASFKKDKLGISAFANRYSTSGYDLDKAAFGNTVDPYINYTFQSKLNYSFSKSIRIGIAGRFFSEAQNSVTNIATEDQPEIIKGDGTVKDYNINPTLSVNFSARLKTTLRFYHTHYETSSKLLYERDGTVYDQSFFNQNFTRPEVQSEYFLNAKNTVTLGIGKIWETVTATRYEDKKQFETRYAYFQYEWKPVEKLNILAGGRYDSHSAYASQFSPKLSAQYNFLPWLFFGVSSGVGFKAPDFRQLYLNFTNPVAGYSVFGTQEVAAGVAKLQKENQITDVLADLSTFGNIRAESSVAFNFGFKVIPATRVAANINVFRNDIKDLIDTQIVALKSNGQNVFSYINREAVFTQGVETDVNYTVNTHFVFSAGYQYLIAKDKSVIDQLKRGDVFARDPETQITKRVTESQYGGLFNRSRNMINTKVFYTHAGSGLTGSLRAIYRGRYGFADRNSNGILDADNEYVKGYATINISVAKSFKDILRLQLGCDNLMDYTNSQNIPSMPGRLVWASLGISLSNGQQ